MSSSKVDAGATEQAYDVIVGAVRQYDARVREESPTYNINTQVCGNKAITMQPPSYTGITAILYTTKEIPKKLDFRLWLALDKVQKWTSVWK